MPKNKLNLHTYGIHLLNPYKTVVSHLKSLNERFAAWVRTAHGCLDTYGRRATITIDCDSKRALIKEKAVVYY